MAIIQDINGAQNGFMEVGFLSKFGSRLSKVGRTNSHGQMGGGRSVVSVYAAAIKTN